MVHMIFSKFESRFFSLNRDTNIELKLCINLILQMCFVPNKVR